MHAQRIRRVTASELDVQFQRIRRVTASELDVQFVVAGPYIASVREPVDIPLAHICVQRARCVGRSQDDTRHIQVQLVQANLVHRLVDR
jgi:hypothetical protein